tara:strand:- start:13 stop:543 length:531 start_codon:yes stop_codon:yes gene_type:complete
MLDALITSKTRVRLLVKFFLNPTLKAYLRQLANEFGESTNSVRLELNRLKEAGLLESHHEGNTIVYQAKQNHPLFPEIRKIVTKVTGIDSVVESLIERIGNMEHAYLVGDYAKGMDTGLIDVVLIGELDKTILQEAIDTAEKLIDRKIRTLVLTKDEFESNTLKKNEPFLLLWSKN